MRSAKVRRAKLYYLRDLKGKAARMKEVARRRQELTRTNAGWPVCVSGDAHAGERAAPRRIRVRGRRRRGRARVPGRPGRGGGRRPAPRPTHSGVCDSKLVPAAEREQLFDKIIRHAVAWAVASADPPEIDRINIHQASLRAMHRAILALAPLPDIVLVDAFRVPDLPMAQRGVPHGDRRCSAIAAASIVAKVTRDRLMLELHDTGSALRIRPPQGVRDRRSSRGCRTVRLLGRAPAFVPAADAV